MTVADRNDTMKDEERMNPGESLLAALTFRLLLTLTAGLVLGGPSAFAQTPKDTVVMAKQIDDMISLDPAEAFEFSGSEAVANIYDRLIGINFSQVSELRGELAESWSVADDGETYTFKIRPNVKFHSGNPVAAEDAAWSLQRAVILNKSPGFILTQFGFTKENAASRIRAVDPLTLILKTEKPVAPTFFYNCLTAVVGSVVDSKLVKAQAKGDDLGNEWLKTNSAGSGAYKLRAWRASESYTLEANASWYNGAPKAKRIVVRHVIEPVTQRLLLEKGDVDYARNMTKDQLAALAHDKDVGFEQGRKGTLLYVGLNQKNPNLRKPEVREALKWLVDYDAIEKNIVAGRYVRHEAFLPKGFLGAIDDKPYKLDVVKAKKLLAKAGLPSGFEVTMDVQNTSPFMDVAQAIQANWSQAGVKLTLVPSDGKQLLTKYRARNHDTIMYSWGADYQDPHSNAEAFSMNDDNTENAKSKTLAWRNSWHIPELTKRAAEAVLERDAKKREEIYQQLQREHQRIAPFIIMFQEIEIAARRKTASGLVIGPTFGSNLYYAIEKR
jgi:peptide/nickel transport system substrate-binding protein